MRVEAFENAANAHSNLRPKRLKEVVSKDQLSRSIWDYHNSFFLFLGERQCYYSGYW